MARKPKDAQVDLDAKVNASLVCKHMNAIREAKDENASAGSAVEKVHKAAKADGLNLDALKLAMRLGKMDPAEASRFWMMTGLYAEARWPGLLEQNDLFSGKIIKAMPDQLEFLDLRELEAAGRTAGLRGELGRHDHNHETGSAQAQAWERGHHRGEKEREEMEAETGRSIAAPATGRRVAKGAEKKPAETAGATGADLLKTLGLDALKEQASKLGVLKPKMSRSAMERAIRNAKPIAESAGPVEAVEEDAGENWADLNDFGEDNTGLESSH